MRSLAHRTEPPATSRINYARLPATACRSLQINLCQLLILAAQFQTDICSVFTRQTSLILQLYFIVYRLRSERNHLSSTIETCHRILKFRDTSTAITLPGRLLRLRGFFSLRWISLWPVYDAAYLCRRPQVESQNR